jgi:catechol 2,3-dioxygenase-like lactoylglutathione lyase family enzyme
VVFRQTLNSSKYFTIGEPAMKLSKIKKPMICVFVKNIEESKRFYCEILKQKIEMDLGKNLILKDGITLWEMPKKHILRRFGYGKKSEINGYEIYFETDTIEKCYEELTEDGVVFLHDIHEESWGQRTIRFTDPDKNLIEIGESMRIFLGRLMKEHYSFEEISKKTSLSIEKIKSILRIVN